MTHPSRDSVRTGLQAIQTIALLATLGAILVAIGRKDQILETNSGEIAELRKIATDLASASVEATTTNRAQDRRLDDLRDRLAALESSR